MLIMLHIFYIFERNKTRFQQSKLKLINAIK
jgi:hypothetical protein